MDNKFIIDDDLKRDADEMVESYGVKESIELLTEQMERWDEAGYNTTNVWNKIQYLIALNTEALKKEIEGEVVSGDEVPNIGDDGFHEEIKEENELDNSSESDLGDE